MAPEARDLRPSRPGRRWLGYPGYLGYLGYLILLPAFLLLVSLALRKPFGIDEFLYLHWGAEAAQGRFAGSDYFAAHFALLQLVLAPLFLVLDPSSTAPLSAARGIALLLLLAAMTAALALVDGRGRRLLGATLLLSTNVLLISAVEVRPDLLSLALLTCGAVLYLRTGGRAPALVAGLLLGGAILSSEKALLHGLAFAATLVFTLRWAHRQGRAQVEVRRVLCAAAGTVTVLGAAAALLYAADGLHQFRVWLEFALLHETAYPTAELASLKEIGRVLRGAPFLLLAPLGAWHLARRAGRADLGTSGSPGDGRQASFDTFLVAAALTGLLAIVVQKAPYAYSSVPFLLFGTLLAVEALGPLHEALRARFPAAASRRFAAAALGLAAVFLWGEFRKTAEAISSPELARQRAALELLFRITTPADCVYDNSAFAYSRRHVDDFFLMTDATMRMAMRRDVAQRIPAAIRERQCTVFKDDFRTEQLPRSLQRFVRSHYLRIAPDLFLWGQSYPPGSSHVRFEAIAPGPYYIWPETAHFGIGAGGEGGEGGGRTVTLPRGESVLEVAAPGGFSILWLPRDGRPYPPLAGAPGEGSFSRRAPEVSASGSR